MLFISLELIAKAYGNLTRRIVYLGAENELQESLTLPLATGIDPGLFFPSHSLSLSPFPFVEAGVEDSITISVDDTDFSASKTELKNMLDKADLEGHGYEKEEVDKLTTDSSGRKFNSKALFYFKAVRCSEATQTIQELKNLLPGNLLSSPIQSVKFNEFFLVILHCVKARNVDYSLLWFSIHGVNVGLTFL